MTRFCVGGERMGIVIETISVESERIVLCFRNREAGKLLDMCLEFISDNEAEFDSWMHNTEGKEPNERMDFLAGVWILANELNGIFGHVGPLSNHPIIRNAR